MLRSTRMCYEASQKHSLDVFVASHKSSTSYKIIVAMLVNFVDIDQNTWNRLQSYVIEWNPAVEEAKAHQFEENQ